MPSPNPPRAGAASHPPAAPAAAAVFDPPRMAALAQLAGGIAPALSDLITVIRGQAGVLLDRADPDPAAQEPLNQIYTAAERAGSLLRQLQIFSRQQAAHTAVMDLNHFINETAGVLRRLLGGGIPMEFHLAADLPRIVADRDMIEQYLIILALNARDAMPAGGQLRFTTETVKISDGSAPGWPGGRPGDFVVLTVADTGRGIAPEILPRIFEPFFTTKAGGRSQGLGLATAFGIVQQHQGWMAVQSVVNAGASFQAFLPVAPPETVAPSARESDAARPSGGETILFVEDEAAVREFTAFLLKQHGYRVLQATSGPDALEVWKLHAPRIRLLLTDMVLEDGMTGLELAAKLRAENPSLKVICTSGHQRDDMKRFPGLAGGYLYLQKPCRPQMLVAALRALLDE